MKLKSLLLAACAVVGLSASALPNTSATDSLYIADFSATLGQTIEVPIRFSNATAYSALQGVVFTPEGVNIVPYSIDEEFADTTWLVGTGRTTARANYQGNVAYNAISANGISHELRIVVYQAVNKAIYTINKTGKDNEILLAKMNIPENATLGDYKCSVRKMHYSTGLVDQSADGDGPDTEFTVHVVATAVKDVTTAKAVKSVKYYNVAGMESAEPFDGVNIVVTNYTDGTKSTTKVIK